MLAASPFSKFKMSATRTIRHQTISFHVLVLLLVVLCQRCQCGATEAPVNVLINASIVDISSPDSKCCTGAGCPSATLSSRCPFDGDSSTVWTLSPSNQTITLTLSLQTPAALERLEVVLDPSSTIPNSVTITAFNQGENTGVSWTTYFNQTCQPNDPYLRKQGTSYYSCVNGSNKLWSASLPDGLLSVRDLNGQWLWWKTFQNLQVTVTSFGSNESANQAASAMIAVADVRLYGWNPPNSGCNCHPAGLLNVSKPCYDNGTCLCRSSQPNNDQCIPRSNITNPSQVPSNIKYPNYGPVSGGTTVNMTGNFLKLLSEVIIGNTSARNLTGSENILTLKTNAAANESNIDNSLPIRLRFNITNVSDSIVIADTEFTYKPNPNFTGILPRRTILRGGIQLTVSGRNLDSIPSPFIVIVVSEKLDKDSRTKAYLGHPIDNKFCQKKDSTTIICPTPPLPANNNYNTGIATAIVFISLDVNPDPSFGDFTLCQPDINQCTIFVANDPTIIEWNNPIDNPIGFPYYNGQRTMQIRGQGFQYANDGGDYKVDYTVKLDNLQCAILDVVNNDIVFTAPDPKLIGDASKKQQVTLTIGNLVLTVGYVVYYLSWIDDPNHRNALIGGLVGGIGGALVLAIVVFLTVRYLRRRRQRKDQLLDDRDYNYQNLAPYFPEDIKKYSVDYNRINFEGELGKGNFGKVHKGILANSDGSTTAVAIKTLHDGVRSFERKLEFLQEAMLMADFCHDHVLALIAISIHNQKPFVILPLMENGDLRAFVSNKDNAFNAGHLVSFSLQVAEGMEYLAKMKFVHCDLAARNCMINKKFLVKVADFGLARDIFEKEYYRIGSNSKPLPVKWMALECLQEGGVFTEKSDVWSYGVLVWELMTRGRRPYADVDNIDIKRYLERGHRLEKTDATPDFMYDLMQRCWLKESESRPRFQEIVQKLKEVLSVVNSTEDDSSSPRYIDSNVVEQARRSYLQLTADD